MVKKYDPPRPDTISSEAWATMTLTARSEAAGWPVFRFAFSEYPAAYVKALDARAMIIEVRINPTDLASQKKMVQSGHELYVADPSVQPGHEVIALVPWDVRSKG